MLENQNSNINGTEYVIQKWPLPKVLKHQAKILPILKDPLVNMTALSSLAPKEGEEIDEDNIATLMAASADGMMTAMSNVDMEEIFAIVSEGNAFRNKTGVMVPVNFQNFESEGKGIDDIWLFTLAVIKHNYGALLKNVLADSLKSLLA